MQTIGIIGMKGGVGKTTSSACLIMGLRARGYSVTGLDLDIAQAGLSLLLPDSHLVRARDLSRILQQYRASDFCIVDTPPGQAEPIRAVVDLSDGVIVPCVPETLSLRGLASLLSATDRAKVIGLLIVGYRRHTLHHRAVLDKLEQLGHPILSIIPHSVTVPDSFALSTGPFTYRPAIEMGIAKAYETLTEEIIRWAESKR